MNTITQLADQILDEKEWQLSLFLSELLENPRCYLVGNLIKDILPKYSEKRGEHSYTLEPARARRSTVPCIICTLVQNGGIFINSRDILLP